MYWYVLMYLYVLCTCLAACLGGLTLDSEVTALKKDTVHEEQVKRAVETCLHRKAVRA